MGHSSKFAKYVVLHEPRIAIRDSPTIQGGLVGACSNGTVVEVLEVCRKWVRAQTPHGKTGWMLTDGAEVQLGQLMAPYNETLTVDPPKVLKVGRTGLQLRITSASWHLWSETLCTVAVQLRATSGGVRDAWAGPKAAEVRCPVEPGETLAARAKVVWSDGSTAGWSAWTEPIRVPERPGAPAEGVATDICGMRRGRCTKCACGGYEMQFGHPNTVEGLYCAECACLNTDHEKKDPPKSPPQPQAAARRPPSHAPQQTAGGFNRTRDQFLEAFQAWERSGEWQRLYQDTDSGAPCHLFCISDIHTDHKANHHRVDTMPSPPPNSTLIVAGDVCTALPRLEGILSSLVKRYRHVFYVPGNHELWTPGTTSDSISKFLEILELCDRIGVHTRPGLIHPKLAVVPLFSWYKGSFIPSRTWYHDQESTFDGACRWPPSIGNPDDPRNSNADGIADFFLELNERRLKGGPESRAGLQVVTFSHFLPRLELYGGWNALQKVMGCWELDQQLRSIGASFHVFGHSHIFVDRTIEGVRYLQHCLGYPGSGWQPNEPKELCCID
uniref:Calcineurin-like phosphoesterase domain-containing protein n=1 Tax=Eutreptiella gymnastica TaxID=73025 RepID=A0A7S4LHA6_9EUGL